MVQGAFRAVLFDWRGTLVYDPPDEWWVAKALVRAGRVASDEEVGRVVDALQRAQELPEVQADEVGLDTSAALHRERTMKFFGLAGLDAELADCLYALDFEAESHPFAVDAAPVLRALHERGVRIAVVSDIHVDLRADFALARLDKYIDAYVLSFEHGVQKPDPAIFEIALRALDVDASEALMVGDRASHDGGGVKLGITTLLVPPGIPVGQPLGLDAVLRLVG